MVKKKSKNKENKFLKQKILSKPKAKIKGVDAKKFITSGVGKHSLVKEGKTGYIDEEMIEEMKWLG